MTLNRAQRRALKQSMRRRGHVTVTLRGGPMDGWIVKPDAPALGPDWRARYLEEAAIGLHEQVRAEAMPEAPPWADVPHAVRELYRASAKSNHGAGRYVLRRDGLEADWAAEDLTKVGGQTP